MDGKNDQAEQTNQIDNFINQGVDVLILNLEMCIRDRDGPLSALSGKCLNGYEIHMGRTAISGGRGPEDTGRLVDYRAEPEICRPMAYLLETQSDSRQVKTCLLYTSRCV